MLGGGMRQAGTLAAAARIALRDGPGWLADDHRRAATLQDRLRQLPGAAVRQDWRQTNMVWLDFDDAVGDALRAHCEQSNVAISANPTSARLVTHRDLSDSDIDTAATVISSFFNSQ